MILFLTSLLFTYLNFSAKSWEHFYSIGGLSLAKVGPEILSLLVYILLALIFLKKYKFKLSESVNKADLLILGSLFVLNLVSRFWVFRQYFYADDFYYWLNREGTSYSVYQWGPWLSSHSGWVWELARSLGGYNPLPYQVALLLSNFLFSVGIYFLGKYLSKSRKVGFYSSAFFLLTTIHFETFQWLSHVPNFGWQGLLMALSVLALFWQLEKDKAKNPAYLSSCLMIAAVFTGTARTGAFIVILSLLDAIFTFNGFREKNVTTWVRGLIKRQWVYYLPVLIFIFARGILNSGSPRYEEVTAPLSLVFTWLVGVFTTPPDFIRSLSFISTNYLGTFTIMAGGIFLLLAIFIYLFARSAKLKISRTMTVSLIWIVFFALYYTLFGPHVPVTLEALRLRMGPHHLAYPSSLGISLIFGIVFVSVLRFFSKRTGIVLSVLFFALMWVNLAKMYNSFFYLPYETKIVREKFFFDSYRKFIPADAEKIYVYYDDNYLKNSWNITPPEEYFQAFWPGAEIRTIKGKDSLSRYLTKMDSSYLYYIKLDFELRSAIDASIELRDLILKERI